jgi:predicted Zn-dependent peptidase
VLCHSARWHFDRGRAAARGQHLGLGMEHLTAWNAKIDAVTAEMVRALARRLMRTDALTFAIAGDPTGL